MDEFEDDNDIYVESLKMDEDISFLTSSVHSALDQREKVKGKFLAAQRDMQQEREQKLSIIKVRWPALALYIILQYYTLRMHQGAVASACSGASR